MSTPISIDPTHQGAHLRTGSEQEEYLQAEVQRMINLQYHDAAESQPTAMQEGTSTSTETLHRQQQQQTDPVRATATTAAAAVPPPPPPAAALDQTRNIQHPKRSALSPLTKRIPTQLGDLSGMAGNDSNKGSKQRLLLPPSLPPPSPSQGIGLGTMLFSSTFTTSKRKTSSDSIQQHPPTHILLDDSSNNSNRGGGYGSIMTTDNNGDQEEGLLHPSRPSSKVSTCCCTSLYQRLLHSGCWFLEHERSFCYGAIDGLLTGSGLMAAFGALGVLSQTAEWEVRLTVVVFSMAACWADALCLAMGHVWSTYTSEIAHAQEEDQQRRFLERDPDMAKTQLQEWLMLNGGMLRLDAISLVESLEGYPDLFVSTMVGEPLIGGGMGVDVGGGGPSLPPQLPEIGTGAPIHNHDGGGRFGSFESWNLHSFLGNNNARNTIDNHDLGGGIRAAFQESQSQGFAMMAGFGLFATIPSLLWLWLPLLLAAPEEESSLSSTTSSIATEQRSHEGDAVSLTGLIVGLLATIMWVLGVWKSRFSDHSAWVAFGVEKVVTFLVCILMAYGVGLFLVLLMGDTTVTFAAKSCDEEL